MDLPIPDVLNLGLAAVVAILLLREVASIIKAARGRELNDKRENAIRELADVLRETRGADTARIDRLEEEMTRTRDRIHKMARQIQAMIGGT